MDSPTFAFIHTLSSISEAASNAPAFDLGAAPPVEQPLYVEPSSPKQALVVQPPLPVANSSNNGGYTAFDDMPFMNIPLDALFGDMFYQQTRTDAISGQGVVATQAIAEVDNVQGQSTAIVDEQPIVGVFVDQSTGELFVENRKDVLGRGTFGHVPEVSVICGVKMALMMPTQHTRAKDIAKEVKFLTR